MRDLNTVDYFTDPYVLREPYDYFEGIRERGPVVKLPNRDVIMVTGYREALEVHLNNRDFISIITSGGPLLPLPFEPQGDDISQQIEDHRDEFPFANLLVSFDGEAHVAARSLINPLFTPARLKANEGFMEGLADAMVREVVADGGCEVIRQLATPFATLVVADLLGVPDEDREIFRRAFDAAPPPGNIAKADQPPTESAMHLLPDYFLGYIRDRRAAPRGDVMTQLATARYPDGSTPDVARVVDTALLLFAAGQDTSAKLLGNSLLYLAEHQDMQQRLRSDPGLVPDFLEEMLRLEGSIKVTKRLCKRKARIGNTDIPAGAKLVVAVAAANRDAERWEDPQEFRLGRLRIKEHLAFGRGAKACPGAALARAELRIMLRKTLELTETFTVSAAHHGSPGQRNLEYAPTYLIRGLASLNLDMVGR